MSSSQTWNANDYACHAGFVPELGKALLDLLPASAARVLDLGCGDGVLTRELAARHGQVVGVDSSEALVARARAQGLDARLMDGTALTFENEFDAVFSNAALHWMKDADSVLSGVARALGKGGRFVAELGGRGNMASVLAVLERQLRARGIAAETVNPWLFPSPAEYATRLERAGFRLDALWYFPRPTVVPTDVVGWLETFGESFLRPLPRAERAALLAQVRQELAASMSDEHGVWTLDYVRLRFVATKL